MTDDQEVLERWRAKEEQDERERAERVREKTVGEFLDFCEGPDLSTYLDLNKAVSMVLEGAETLYADSDYSLQEDNICFRTVSLAHDAVDAKSIDKQVAKTMARTIAYLADEMLALRGAGEWDFATLVALKKIRRSDPELAKQEQKQGGAVLFRGGKTLTQAEIDAQFPF